MRQLFPNTNDVSMVGLIGRIGLFGLIGLAGPTVPAQEKAYVTNEVSNTISVVDTATQRTIRDIPIGVGMGSCDVVMSPDGSRLYVANGDSNSVSVIRTSDSRVIASIPAGEDPCDLALTSDGRRLYAAGRSLVEIDADNLTLGRNLGDLDLVRGNITLSVDNSRIYVGSVVSQTVWVIDSVKGNILDEFEISAPAWSLTASQDNQTIFAATLSSAILLIDSVTGYERATPIDVGHDAFHIALLESADTIITTGDDSMSISSIERKFPPHLLSGCNSAWGLTLSSKSEFAYVSGASPRGGRGLLCIINLPDRRLQQVIELPTTPGRGLALSPDGRRLYVATLLGQVYVLDTATLEIVSTIVGNDNPAGIGVSPDQLTVVAAGVRSGRVVFVDTRSDEIAREITLDGQPLGIQFSPDSSITYISNDYPLGGGIWALDTASGTVVWEVPLPDGAPGLAVSPDGSRLFASSFDRGAVSVIDVASRSIIKVIPMPSGIPSLSFQPFGSLVFAPNWGPNIVSVINSETNEIEGGIDVDFGDEGAQQSCWTAFSPNGRLASISYDNDPRVGIIDIDQKKVVGSLWIAAPFNPRSCGGAFSRDGRRVYVPNRDNNLLTVIDAEAVSLEAHIPVGLSPYGVAIACPDCPPLTVTPTPTATPTRTATRTPGPCYGDCDGNGAVSVSELVRAVNAALSESLPEMCAAADSDDDGRITISDLVRGVGAAVDGCRPRD